MARRVSAETPVSSFKTKVAPELADSIHPAGAATPHPDNARIHNLPRIAASLQRHGQRTAIVVQSSTGFIVKGNGTWTAAVQILGWDALAMVFQDLPDDQAIAYMLADNKASDDSSYDDAKLVSALEKLVEGPGLLDTLWGNEELEDLVERNAGFRVLEPTEPNAEYADSASAEERKERAEAVGTKHREVPLVLPVADHAEFVGHIQELRERYGTGGTVATVVEALRRQAAAEGEAVKLGRDLEAERAAEVRNGVLREVATAIGELPDVVSKAEVLAVVEGLVSA